MESAGKGDLISVVIPVYNAEKTVARALESVLASDCKNLEAIVVYRDSADNTLEIVKSLADSRVKIVRQGSPTGPGGARNLGIAASSGDWLAFAESDDFVPPNFYPALLAGAKTLGCDIAWGEILCGGEKWNRLGTARVLKTFKQKFSPITNGASFDKLYSARLIKGRKIEFMEGVRYEDNPFVFKAFFYANKIAAVPEAEYCYCFERKSPEQEEKLKNDVLPVAENILSFFSSAGAGEAELSLVKRKIARCFAAYYILDDELYGGLKKAMGHPFFLRLLRLKMILRTRKRAALRRLHLIDKKGNIWQKKR